MAGHSGSGSPRDFLNGELVQTAPQLKPPSGCLLLARGYAALWPGCSWEHRGFSPASLLLPGMSFPRSFPGSLLKCLYACLCVIPRLLALICSHGVGAPRGQGKLAVSPGPGMLAVPRSCPLST